MGSATGEIDFLADQGGPATTGIKPLISRGKRCAALIRPALNGRKSLGPQGEADERIGLPLWAG